MNLSGFRFPYRIAGGSVARATGHEKVRQNLRHLLSVRLGERLMRRDYGGAVHQRVQAANDQTLRTLVRHEIELALRTYLPEARLVSPLQFAVEPATLLITLDYRAEPDDVVHRLALELPRGGA